MPPRQVVRRGTRRNYLGPYTRTGVAVARTAARIIPYVRRTYNSYRNRRNRGNVPRGASGSTSMAQRKLGVRRNCKIRPKLRKKIQCVINENRPQGRDVVINKEIPLEVGPDVARPQCTQFFRWYQGMNYKKIMGELKVLYPSIASTQSVENAILKEKVIIPYWKEALEWMNNSQVKAYLTLYTIEPVSSTDASPVNDMQEALDKIKGDEDMTIRDEGFEPSMAPFFAQKWKTVKTTRRTLLPGKSYTHNMIKKNTYLNNNYVNLQTNTFVKGYVSLVLARISFEKVANSNIFGPYNSGRVSARRHVDIRIQCPNAVADADTVEVLRTGRGSSANFPGAGAAEVIKMDPYQISEKCSDLGVPTVLETGK